MLNYRVQWKFLPAYLQTSPALPTLAWRPQPRSRSWRSAYTSNLSSSIGYPRTWGSHRRWRFHHRSNEFFPGRKVSGEDASSASFCSRFLRPLFVGLPWVECNQFGAKAGKWNDKVIFFGLIKRVENNVVMNKIVVPWDGLDFEPYRRNPLGQDHLCRYLAWVWPIVEVLNRFVLWRLSTRPSSPWSGPSADSTCWGEDLWCLERSCFDFMRHSTSKIRPTIQQ